MPMTSPIIENRIIENSPLTRTMPDNNQQPNYACTTTNSPSVIWGALIPGA